MAALLLSSNLALTLVEAFKMRSLFPPLGLERLPYIANYTVQIVYLSDSKNLRTTYTLCAVWSVSGTWTHKDCYVFAIFYYVNCLFNIFSSRTIPHSLSISNLQNPSAKHSINFLQFIRFISFTQETNFAYSILDLFFTFIFY